MTDLSSIKAALQSAARKLLDGLLAELSSLGSNQHTRLLRLHTPLGLDVLLAEKAEITEHIGPQSPTARASGFGIELLALSTRADVAIALHPEADNRFGGHTTAAYANMVGPFGGITAATLLEAICRHPARLGDPLAFTVNFAGPVADGPFQLPAVPVRTNRSTQHWRVELIQDDSVATTATAVFGVRRETGDYAEKGCSSQRMEIWNADGAPVLAGMQSVALFG